MSINVTRPIIVGVCPACAGQGVVPAEDFEQTGAMLACRRCGGGGDLDAARLMEAYDCGRRDALAAVRHHLRELGEMVPLALEALEHPPTAPTIAQLRQRVGG
jgi:hypothetical protein